MVLKRKNVEGRDRTRGSMKSCRNSDRLRTLASLRELEFYPYKDKPNNFYIQSVISQT